MAHQNEILSRRSAAALAATKKSKVSSAAALDKLLCEMGEKRYDSLDYENALKLLNGIIDGMTDDEFKKYLAEIAAQGAEKAESEAREKEADNQAYENRYDPPTAEQIESLRSMHSDIIGPIGYVKPQHVVEAEAKDAELHEEIRAFLYTLRGKTRATREEVEKMFKLYNRKYNTHESDFRCDLCVARIYSRLEKLVCK